MNPLASLFPLLLDPGTYDKTDEPSEGTVHHTAQQFHIPEPQCLGF